MPEVKNCFTCVFAKKGTGKNGVAKGRIICLAAAPAAFFMQQSIFFDKNGSTYVIDPSLKSRIITDCFAHVLPPLTKGKKKSVTASSVEAMPIKTNAVAVFRHSHGWGQKLAAEALGLTLEAFVGYENEVVPVPGHLEKHIALYEENENLKRQIKACLQG